MLRDKEGLKSRSRGVAILEKKKKNAPFRKIWTTWVDPGGTYVGVQGMWGRQSITLVSLYAPHRLQDTTLSKVASILLESDSPVHVVGGETSMMSWT